MATGCNAIISTDPKQSLDDHYPDGIRDLSDVDESEIIRFVPSISNEDPHDRGDSDPRQQGSEPRPRPSSTSTEFTIASPRLTQEPDRGSSDEPVSPRSQHGLTTHARTGPLSSGETAGQADPESPEDRGLTNAGNPTGALGRSETIDPWHSPQGAMVTVALAAGTTALLVRVVLGLFARIPTNKVLEHPRRAAIMDHIRADPGAEVSAVARKLDMARGVALHHIKRLRQEGFIRITKLNGRTALFAAESGHLGHEEATVLLRREASRNLYEAIRARPGIDQSTLADSLGITQQRVSLLLRRMLAAGVVSKDRESGRLVYYPAGRVGGDAAIQALPDQEPQSQTSD